MGYLLHFIVYFLAMIGITVLALFIYKKFNISSFSSRKIGMLRVEDTLSLSPRKTLYVVREGNERFLIAADIERTTLISKLSASETETRMLSAPDRTTYRTDLSESAVRAQDNLNPVRKQIMKEIKNKLEF